VILKILHTLFFFISFFLLSKLKKQEDRKDGEKLKKKEKEKVKCNNSINIKYHPFLNFSHYG
jgi:hypothetical protein